MICQLDGRTCLELATPSHIQIVIQTDDLPIAQKHHHNLQQILQKLARLLKEDGGMARRRIQAYDGWLCFARCAVPHGKCTIRCPSICNVAASKHERCMHFDWNAPMHVCFAGTYHVPAPAAREMLEQ